jgi:hypothetical protein
LAKPYIEFIHSQQLSWLPAPPGVGGPRTLWKVLSRDDETGAVAALVRIAAGTALPGDLRLRAAWELFVLKGEIVIGGKRLAEHYYAWYPPSHPLGVIGAAREAIVLSFFSAAPETATPGESDGDGDERVGPVDTVALKWDRTGFDPNIDHLNAARKNLRFDPGGRCRTYLLGGMPQGFPYQGTPLETHPHAEEFFMVSGDMACHVGIMRTGAYFNRPPGIAHGRDCTRTGFLLFCRTPGSNRTISEWTPEKYPVTWRPEHRPVLPPELREAGSSPMPDPLAY